MCNKTIEYIAEKLLAAYPSNQAETESILNIEDMVMTLGGSIEYYDDLGLILDGPTAKQSESTFVFRIPTFEKKSAQRRLIAIALGHLILHMGFLMPDDRWDNQPEKVFPNFSANQTYEAVCFAHAVLMPENDYRNALLRFSKNGIVNTEAVAEWFGVSISQMITRGRQLGCLR